MTPDANDLCVFAVKRGDIYKKEIYCNLLYPFFISLMDRYKNSPYCNGNMSEYLYVNPKTDCRDLIDSASVSFVPMTNILEQSNIVEYDMVPYSTVKKGFTVFKKGDMIWAKITPCMQNGKSCIVDDMPTEIGFGSTEFHVIRKKNDQVYMPFIWSIFSNENVLKAAQAVFSGSAGQQRVSQSFLENFPCVIPDYEIQVSLASRLELALLNKKQKLKQADELLSKTSDYILKQLGIDQIVYKENLGRATTLSQIRRDKTFGVEYYHPERMKALHSLRSNPLLSLEKLEDIVFFNRNVITISDNSDYLGLAGVESQTGELSGAQEEASGQAYQYKKGNVLYGRLRPYLNKVLYAEKDGICSTEFHVMEVKDESEILPEYLSEILRSNLILSQTKHMMTGNTHPRISNDDMKNLYIPIPDIALQKTIVEEIHNRRIKARQLKIEAKQEWEAAKEQFEKELLA